MFSKSVKSCVHTQVMKVRHSYNRYICVYIRHTSICDNMKFSIHPHTWAYFAHQQVMTFELHRLGIWNTTMPAKTDMQANAALTAIREKFIYGRVSEI